MKIICFLLISLEVVASELIQNPGSNLSTKDIGTSYIYPESKPLNIVLIHHYNPSLTPSIALRTKQPINSPLGSYQESYLVINRPLSDQGQSLLLRPHYWLTRNQQGGNLNINVQAKVMNLSGNTLLDGNHNVHVHDHICSPSNMPLNLSLEPGSSHLLYSLVNQEVSTCHWIPTEHQWEKIWEMEFQENKSSTIEEFLSKLIISIPEDPYFTVVKEILNQEK
jgi:hypothetical protein